MTTSRRDPGNGAPAAAFIVSVLCSAGLVVVYLRGGQPQLEGALLGGALGGIGVGLILWAKRFLPGGHDVQERGALPSTDVERARAERAFEEGAALVERRRFLVRAVGAALAALGVVALFPIRSLGRSPGRALFVTEWRKGVRAVTESGEPVTIDSMPIGSVATLYPEGHVGSADSQAIAVRIDPSLYRPLPGRADWAPEGLVCFSKVCTHAGCPVGLYQAGSHRLFCPCHQSVFDVLNAAEPIGGPASRPLPQLPLALDSNGSVIAQGDFSGPIGPGFWNLNDG
jgi:ubiquinol-cytochrome c reductase iron-sulfur subunit